MLSRLQFDLGDDSLPVIEGTVTNDRLRRPADVRDKIAKSFVERFKYLSSWCTVEFKEDGTFIIAPVEGELDALLALRASLDERIGNFTKFREQ